MMEKLNYTCGNDDYIKLIIEKFNLYEGYENTKTLSYTNREEFFKENTYDWDNIKCDSKKMPICINRKNNGKLSVTVGDISHTAIVAGTGYGKTQLIKSFIEFIIQAKETNAEYIMPSALISDPKNNELYKEFKDKLKKYANVITLNFNDFKNSDHYNIFTNIYRDYQKIQTIYDDVEAVVYKGKYKNKLNNVIYEDRKELERGLEREKEDLYLEYGNKIKKLAFKICPPVDPKNTDWENGGRSIIEAGLYAMNEDELPFEEYNIATLTYNLDALGGTDDNEYFADRNIKSEAYRLAKPFALCEAKVTRAGYISVMQTSLAEFKNPAIRRIMSDNTFEISDLIDESKPTFLFISYPEESGVFGTIVSMFLSMVYTELVEASRKNDDKARERPFIFLLDEFGNLPQFPKFDTAFTEARARNIWFWIVLQSYAQLNNIYGENLSKIIRDNLNWKIFLGTNNRETAEEFSSECGKITRCAPSSIIDGVNDKMYNKIESIQAVPISKLSELKEGECIIKGSNTPIIFSKFERHYKCKEFKKTKEQEQSKQSDITYVKSQKQVESELEDFENNRQKMLDLEKEFISLIEGKKTITIAEIQACLGTKYTIAHELLKLGQNRKWIGLKEDSDGAKILKKLDLDYYVDLSEEECESISDKLNIKSLILLRKMLEKKCFNICELRQEMNPRVHYGMSLEQMIEIFEDSEIISRVGEYYFINITEKSVMEIEEYLKKNTNKKTTDRPSWMSW